LKITGGRDVDKKNLLDIYVDPKTSQSDKALIQEFLGNTNEKNESLDADVRKNPTAHTWSILTRSQSTVREMMKFDTGGFAGKDTDEIQTMEWFFRDMKEAVKQNTFNKSPEQIKIFMDKFFNRFEEKWFSWTEKTDLIRRLKRCQKNPGRKEVDNVLYYSIVWKICNSFGHVHIPTEFEDALLAWTDFFKHNLNTILQPDIIVRSFSGNSYEDDYKKYEPQLELREDCVNILDKDLRQAYMYGLSQDQKKPLHQYQAKLKSKTYLNAELYDLADKLSKNCNKENRFRGSIGEMKKPKSSAKVTWAKIINTTVVDKVRAILEGTPLTSDEPPPEDYDYE